MSKKTCTCEKFYAHQIVRMDIEVDIDNNFICAGEIYDSEEPYGPYTCMDCGQEYDELPEKE